jgi:hypothetical protein
VQPILNQVMAIVDTNHGLHGITSGNFYNHFSLRSIGGGFKLRCLNNACAAGVNAMTDLFAQ